MKLVAVVDIAWLTGVIDSTDQPPFRFRSRVNHSGESELVKYPISLTEIAFPSSPLDELDGKSGHPLLANGQAVQPRCACRLNGNHRPESCEANQELGSKIFSLEIPTANLSGFSTWGDKTDTNHAIMSPTSRCHGRDGSPLCIECLANERKPLGLSTLDLTPISTQKWPSFWPCFSFL